MVAPLAREFRGSHYHMTRRATLIARVHTSDGVVGEAYVGDEDASLLEIERIVHDEIAPVVIGHDAMATERCWDAAQPVTFDIFKGPPYRARCPGRVRYSCLGCSRQGPWSTTLASVGGLSKLSAADSHRRLLRRAARPGPRGDSKLQGARPRRRQVQGRRGAARPSMPSASRRLERRPVPGS